jgi:putative lipoprotein
MEPIVFERKIAALLVSTALIAACKSTPTTTAPPPAEPPPPVAAAEQPPVPAAVPEPAPVRAVTPAMTASVTGKVTYRIRKALPPEAIVKVQLLDITLADQPAKLLGEQVIEAKGRQVLFAYKIPYDPKAILPKNRYQVSARIEVNGELWFMNDTAARVLTGGNPKRRDIVVKQVKSP